MRCTAEIISDVKDNIDVDKEELRLALLVLDSINFVNHGRMKRLLSGGVSAKLTSKEFPGQYAKLGISEDEYKMINGDPEKVLGPDHIPGTEEWKSFHRIANRVYDKVMHERLNTLLEEET